MKFAIKNHGIGFKNAWYGLLLKMIAYDTDNGALARVCAYLFFPDRFADAFTKRCAKALYLWRPVFPHLKFGAAFFKRSHH
jgi:hypothetical protein